MTVEPSLAAPNPFNGILYTVLIVLRTGDIDFAVGFGAHCQNLGDEHFSESEKK